MNPPDGGVDAELPGVAPRLRDLRRGRNLTLETAARLAGLSPAHLSRLETGNRQPSLPMLLGEVPPERDAIVRGGRFEGAEADGWMYRQAGGPGRVMQALRVRVPFGAQGDLVRVHPGEEWLYVLEGRLRVVLGESAHDLGPGDSAHFDSLTPHRIAAVEQRGCELLFVHTLLQSPAAELCLGAGTLRR